MQEYELTIITEAELIVVKQLELEEIIRRHANIMHKTIDGVKRLAYPIRGRERGLFMFYELELNRDEATRLGGELNINDNVMRFLLVRKDPRRK